MAEQRHVAEEDGDTAANASPPAVTDKPRILPFGHIIDAKAAETGVTLDPLTGAEAELRDSKTGRFVKGHRALAGGGRPKRGEGLLAYTKKLIDKPQNMQAVAEAHLDRLLDRGSVGNRAWADHRDTYHGVPKQTLVMERGADPLAELMADIAAAGGLRSADTIYIEATAADITTDEAT